MRSGTMLYLPQKWVNCCSFFAPHFAPEQKQLYLFFFPLPQITQKLLRPSSFPNTKKIFLFAWEKHSVQNCPVFFSLPRLHFLLSFCKNIHICSSPNSICSLVTPSQEGHERAAAFLTASHLSNKEQDKNITFFSLTSSSLVSKAVNLINDNKWQDQVQNLISRYTGSTLPTWTGY